MVRMGYRFDDETATSALGHGRWGADLSDRWNIGEYPNGGYLLATALRAVSQVSPHPDPVSVTAHFLRPGTGGAPADITASVLRTGRSLTTARAGLDQDGTGRLEVLTAFGDLGTSSGDGHEITEPPPDIPPPEACREREGLEQGVELHIQSRLETRIPGPMSTAGEAGIAEMAGWIRFSDGRQPDSLAAVLFADAFPPSIFGLLGRVGWVPTVELTVHVRRRPAEGWVCGRFVTDDLLDGRMIETGTLWDSTGTLFARSRQLAMLLPEDDDTRRETDNGR